MPFDDLVPRQGTSTPGTTNTQVMDEVPLTVVRDSIVITNTSTGTQSISIGDGIAAVSGSGPTLNPGQSYVDSTDSKHKCSQNRIYVIGSAGSAACSFYEKLLRV